MCVCRMGGVDLERQRHVAGQTARVGRATEATQRHHPLWQVSLASGDPAIGTLAMGSITTASDLRFA